MVLPKGIEPSTRWLKANCAARLRHGSIDILVLPERLELSMRLPPPLVKSQIRYQLRHGSMQLYVHPRLSLSVLSIMSFILGSPDPH